MSISEQTKTLNYQDTDTAVERAAWSKPSMSVYAASDYTEGAFIPGPAEIPSLCS